MNEAIWNIEKAYNIELENGENIDSSNIDVRVKNLYRLNNNGEITELFIQQNNISNLNPISNLVKLEHLKIFDNNIKDISSLSKLVNLRKLDIGHNPINNINLLRKLPNLAELGITNLFNIDFNNDQKAIETLCLLKNLTRLSISANKINKISFIQELTNLEILTIQSNNLTTIKSLAYLKNLKELNISANGIYNISYLANLFQLETLFIARLSGINIDLNQNTINTLKNLKSLKKTCCLVNQSQ